MRPSAEPRGKPALRSGLLRQLTRRLEATSELATHVRGLLPGGDPVEIDAATARLETLAQEFKVLTEELRRLPAEEPPADDPALDHERRALEAATARLARSSALSGGLLERLVAVSRGLLDLMALAKDGTYERTGRVAEIAPCGVRLRERV